MGGIPPEWGRGSDPTFANAEWGRKLMANKGRNDRGDGRKRGGWQEKKEAT